MAREDPILSVVTIAKNEEERIQETINSVQRISESWIEHILVIAESFDRTYEIAQENSLKFQNIVLRKQDGFGISSAFNQGIDLSKGRYINFLNAGDVVSRDFDPKSLLSVLNICYQETIFFSVCYFTRNAHLESVVDPTPTTIFKKMEVFHPSTFFSSDLVRKLGGYRTDFYYAMDCELLHKILTAYPKYLSLNIVYARMDTTGISDKHYIRGTFEFLKSLSEHRSLSLLSCFSALGFIIKKTLLRIFKRLLSTP